MNKNENKMNDMIDILQELHQFVPNARNAAEIEEINQRDESSHMTAIPLGGDQLTCERIRGAHMVRIDGETAEERLEGVMATIEDFHEKMNFLQLIMDRFYKSQSSREAGTLYQLRCAINRRNVVNDATKDYHAVSAFIDLALDSHVIASFLTFVGMTSVNSTCSRIARGYAIATEEQKKRNLTQIVGEYVDAVILQNLQSSISHVGDENGGGIQENLEDKVHNYNLNFMRYALLRRINVIATRSGDGDRVIRHWKYAMLLYSIGHRVKYQLEAFLLLANVSCLATHRMSRKIVLNRFINLKGGIGNNLDGDYVMELLNRYAKSRIKLLGPNQHPEIVDRIGKTMMSTHVIQEAFEKELLVSPISRNHKEMSIEADRTLMTNELLKANVFKLQHGRVHASFPDEYSDLLYGIDAVKYHKWLIEKKAIYAANKMAF